MVITNGDFTELTQFSLFILVEPAPKGNCQVNFPARALPDDSLLQHSNSHGGGGARGKSSTGCLCYPAFVHSPLRSSSDTNYSKLKYLVASSVSEACNNSVLLLGPRGCRKDAVLDIILMRYPWLNGMLHSDDNCATKEIARQLCLEHQLSFSKMASSDDNTDFMIDMLRECGLAHKTVIFVLEEFDLFAQDADQLLEKRVRSRFSHRKLLFVPSSLDDIQRLMEHLLMLDKNLSLPKNYVTEYNSRLTSIFGNKKFKGILDSLTDADATTSNILRFLFRVVSYMDMESGLLSMECFTHALSCMQRQPKLDSLQEVSFKQHTFSRTHI
ncbi:hypothetical protein ACQ4PT_046239 [Festuca glaucescens]